MAIVAYFEYRMNEVYESLLCNQGGGCGPYLGLREAIRITVLQKNK